MLEAHLTPSLTHHERMCFCWRTDIQRKWRRNEVWNMSGPEADLCKILSILACKITNSTHQCLVKVGAFLPGICLICYIDSYSITLFMGITHNSTCQDHCKNISGRRITKCHPNPNFIYEIENHPIPIVLVNVWMMGTLIISVGSCLEVCKKSHKQICGLRCNYFTFDNITWGNSSKYGRCFMQAGVYYCNNENGKQIRFEVSSGNLSQLWLRCSPLVQVFTNDGYED